VQLARDEERQEGLREIDAELGDPVGDRERDQVAPPVDARRRQLARSPTLITPEECSQK